MLQTEVVSEPAGIERLRDAWDALAVARAMPLLAPSWALAWWRHLAPAEAEPRVVAVRDGDEIVAIAPFYAIPGPGGAELRLISGDVGFRTAPLAVAGREWEVARPLAEALAGMSPAPALVYLDGYALDSPWLELLRERWPGALRPLRSGPIRPSSERTPIVSAPTVSLDVASYDDWLAGKSANFRGQARRWRRRLERSGGRVRLATVDTLAADLEAFARLHAQRWEGREESGVLLRGQGLIDMLQTAGQELVPQGRMRVWVAELDGVPIAVQVFVAAGGEVAYWNGGWDERHAPLRPGLVTILAAIEDAIGRGERRLDLGPVEYPYKLRLADGNAPLCWDGLIVPGPRSVLTVAQLAPLRARLSAREALRRGLAGERFERVLELKRRFGRRALVAAIAERAGGRARRRG